MAQVLPKIMPINELKNTAKISKTCKESDVPPSLSRRTVTEIWY